MIGCGTIGSLSARGHMRFVYEFTDGVHRFRPSCTLSDRTARIHSQIGRNDSLRPIRAGSDRHAARQNSNREKTECKSSTASVAQKMVAPTSRLTSAGEVFLREPMA